MTVAAKQGVLLVNLGTPDAPQAPEVRRYLREFLSDPRVLDINAVGRWLLLNLIILPTRPKKSAEAYRKVWTDEGSPLLVNSQRLTDGVAAALPDHEVVLAMRYGSPSIADGLARLRAAGCDQITVLPLYPQYAASSTASTIEKVFVETMQDWKPPFVTVLPPFYDEPRFIEAFAQVGQPTIDDLAPDHVLMSFHGLPERHILKGDPTGGRHCLQSDSCCDAIGPNNRNCYRAQCHATARALAARLGIAEDMYSVTFQSRLGRTPWIKPYTDEVLVDLTKRGVKRLAVFCPAFVADCLETLEEIGMGAREDFIAAGGEDLRLVPSLNGHPAWIEAVVGYIAEATRRGTSRRRPVADDAHAAE